MREIEDGVLQSPGLLAQRNAGPTTEKTCPDVVLTLVVASRLETLF